MREIAASLLFSRCVWSLRQCYETKAIVKRCVHVAKRIEEFPNSIYVAQTFADECGGRILQMNDDEVTYHLERIAGLDKSSKEMLDLIDEELSEGMERESFEASSEKQDIPQDEPVGMDIQSGEQRDVQGEEGQEGPLDEASKVDAVVEATKEASSQAVEDLAPAGLTTAVAELEIPEKLIAILVKAGINTVGDIKKADLSLLEGVGEKSVATINAAVAKVLGE